jgi:hypothetical protein
MQRTAKVAFALMFGALVVGCGQGSGVGTDFTDRQIFEGALFGAGPAADVLPEARTQLRPELYARSADALSAMADARAAIIDEVELTHPGLVADFGQAARSGDPAKVQAALERAIAAVSETTAYAASARGKNVPIERRGQNVPGELSKNVPIERRGQNVPGELSKNVPIERRGQNVPGDIRAVHPAWDLLNSKLFSEQLSASVAMTFGGQTAQH